MELIHRDLCVLDKEESMVIVEEEVEAVLALVDWMGDAVVSMVHSVST